MPIFSDWCVTKRVVYSRVVGDLSLDDLAQASQRMITLLDQGDAPIHHIADMYAMGEYPLDLKAITKAMPFLRHSKLGWFIGVRPRHVVADALANMLMQAAGVEFRIKATHEGAVQLLRRIDSSLTTIEIQFPTL
jgi:hypothetical protein